MLASECCNNAEFCPLAKEGMNVVTGEGNVGADYPSVMFIGRDPGEQENRDCRPFVGDSGKFLRGVIRDTFVSDAYVYITNLVKCHTPGNRGPTQDEIMSCSHILVNEIRAMLPRVIVALGLDVAKYMLSGHVPNADSLRMKDIVGKSFKIRYPIGSGGYYVVRIIPCYHPSPLNQSHYPKIKEIISSIPGVLKVANAEIRQGAVES